MFFGNCRSRRHRDMMHSMMDSKLLQVVAVGALVYMGTKAIGSMMDD
jgi:hypothetical protein